MSELQVIAGGYGRTKLLEGFLFYLSSLTEWNASAARFIRVRLQAHG